MFTFCWCIYNFSANCFGFIIYYWYFVTPWINAMYHLLKVNPSCDSGSLIGNIPANTEEVYFSFQFIPQSASAITRGGGRGKTQIQLYPGLPQFIQLHFNLYITDTLYSGEIIGRIIHVARCDAPRTQILVWKTRKGGEQSFCGVGGGYGLYTLPMTPDHLPLTGQSACTPTCT